MIIFNIINFRTNILHSHTPVFYFIISLSSFSVGSLLGFAHGYDNSTISSKLNEFNFVAAGDFGCNREAKTTIKDMASMKPELVLALGDLAYKSNPNCWFKMI
jgi:phosphodiesterase/alkaline phosphatase D-like protein